jgi:hypothetical protein
MLSPYHLQVAERFAADLAEALAAVPLGAEGATDPAVSTYGGIA